MDVVVPYGLEEKRTKPDPEAKTLAHYDPAIASNSIQTESEKAEGCAERSNLCGWISWRTQTFGIFKEIYRHRPHERRRRRISIRVHGAKHDPDDKGYVMRFQENETMSCVVGWMDHHKSHRIENITFDDFFPLFAIRTAPVTVELAKSWLKADAQAAGLIGHNYTAYSLRRGLATTLFLVGASPNTIKRFGRWRSDSYKDYIELDPATTAMWSMRLLRTQLRNFGPLSLEEAAQLTLSSVDEFFTKYRHKRTC